jgi:excisionase family DNA binding protein
MTNNESRKENEQKSIGIARLLSPKNVSEILGISVKTVHKLVRDGKLGCVQVNDRDRRFTEDQVREYVEERTLKVRVDMKRPVSVSSRSKKGGDENSRTKSFEAQVTGSLVQELKTLCR